MSSFTVKSISFLWLLLGYSLVPRWLFVTIKHIQSLVLNKSSVFFRMTLIHHAHSSKFMEWHSLGVTKLTHLTMSFPEKIDGNSGMVYFAERNQTPPPTQFCSVLEE